MSAVPTAAPRIAVLIPCFDEALSIGKVVADFRAALPDAAIHVYDNNSTDGTAEAARRAGALVGRESLPGKGNVVRRMFADVEADCYLLVDGDDTYDARAAPAMVALLLRGNDLVTGARSGAAEAAYRPGHRLGNRLLTRLVGRLFGRRISDMLSGYRALSRRFVKSFPAATHGFEIETELSIHALEQRLPVAELAVGYRDRAPGSQSKLRTWQDGLRIAATILTLLRTERPVACYGGIALVLALAAIGLGAPLVSGFLATGKVPRLPTAVLATGLVLLACISLGCGLVLEQVTRGRKEQKRLAYLAIAHWGAAARHPAPPFDVGNDVTHE